METFNLMFFEESKKAFKQQLSISYEVRLQKAKDKDYLRSFFIKTFSGKNKTFPFDTVYFQELYKFFTHYYNFGETNCIELTLEQLTLIEEESTNAFEKAMISQICIMKDENNYSIPIPYLILMEQKNYDLSELIQLEKSTFVSSPKFAFNLLVSYESIKEFISTIQEEKPTVLLEMNTSKHTHQFTHSQQVLFAYYLLKLAKIEPRVQADISACASFLHALTGIPYTNIKNSDLYKKFLNPLDHNSSSKTLKDLEFVKQHFKALNNLEIIELIDKDIRGIQ